MKRFFIWEVVLLSFLAVSCEETDSDNKGEYVLTDHRGKPIPTDRIADRVVILEVCTPPVYRAVDGSIDHIINTTKDAYSAVTGSKFYSAVIPEFENQKATILNPSGPNIEEIIKDGADVVFHSTHYKKSLDLMDKMGLHVIGLDGSTMEKRRDFIKFCGAVSGKTERAEELIQLQIDNQKKFERPAIKIPSDKRVSIVNITSMNNSMQVAAKNSIAYDLIAIDNLAENLGDSWKTINTEQLLIWDPDILLISSWLVNKSPDDIYKNPLLQELSAVKNKRVYKVPQTNRFTETIEVFLMYEWLWRLAYDAIHPKEENFRTVLKEAFKKIYGKTIDDDMIDILLEMDYNRDAKDYQRLFGVKI